MSRAGWSILRDLLSERYDELRLRLTRRLGSEELAKESLHEAWIRLHRQDQVSPIQSPSGYLLRMALNIAIDRKRAETRRARRSDLQAALTVADPAPGPAEITEARRQLAAFRMAIDLLPDRTRKILIAARLEAMPQQQIAEHFGISTRMVRIELRRALEHCEAFLQSATSDDGAPRLPGDGAQSAGSLAPPTETTERGEA